MIEIEMERLRARGIYITLQCRPDNYYCSISTMKLKCLIQSYDVDPVAAIRAAEAEYDQKLNDPKKEWHHKP